MKRTVMLKVLNHSKYTKYLFGTLFLFISLSCIYVGLDNVYRNTVTGDFLLNVKSVTVQNEVTIGQDINATICRIPRYKGIVSSTNIRTHYFVKDAHTIVQAGQNVLPPVAYEVTSKPCVPVTIKPERYPQAPGYYYFCQQVVFNAWGKEKIANFCSNEFVLEK